MFGTATDMQLKKQPGRRNAVETSQGYHPEHTAK